MNFEQQFEQQYADNLKHAMNPEPGDYWHEMLCPVLVVLEVTDKSVTYCETVKFSNAGQWWMWDLSETGSVPLYDFRYGLEYQYPQMKGKFWAWVSPRAHIKVLNHWAQEEYECANE